MSNVEAIKKALEGVTPDRLRYEADAMFAAVQGERRGYTLHARNWGYKPHRVLYDAISLMRDAASTLEALQRENERLRNKVDARALTDQQLDDEIAAVSKACEGGFGEGSGSPGEWWYERADELEHERKRRELENQLLQHNSRTALASAGEEHHADK